MYVSIVTSGLLRELGAERWQTLCALAAYANGEGYCYPTTERLAADLGVSRETVSRRMKVLCEFQWNGAPVVTKTSGREAGAAYPNNRYLINPAVMNVMYGDDPCDANVTLSSSLYLSSFNSLKDLKHTDVTQASHNPAATKAVADYNARDILNYFCAKHEETYGVAYLPNYSRECSMIKTKLLPTYGAERLLRIIDATFAWYDHKWSSPQYPRPTIGQLATWLANKASAMVEDAPVSVDEAQELDYETLKREGRL